MTRLVDIQQHIDARVNSILADQPDWPCRRGCDHCCRHLASPPRLTAAEWDNLYPALLNLPATVHQNILDLKPAPPVACPLLDAGTGACLVYNQRPIACRTYGFYVERDLGLYCHTILHRVEHHELDYVVWGNAQSVEQQLADLGPTRALTDWYRERFLCPPL